MTNTQTTVDDLLRLGTRLSHEADFRDVRIADLAAEVATLRSDVAWLYGAMSATQDALSEHGRKLEAIEEKTSGVVVPEWTLARMRTTLELGLVYARKQMADPKATLPFDHYRGQEVALELALGLLDQVEREA
jgi:hypothetical protein